ncbi:MAG: T9SS type A sorting domain-containing protein, partial [candidate division WOR-3 bacterium]|nr:T9SS type A sorting domain-containing protein [candidate division WOR-3 bacterium]
KVSLNLYNITGRIVKTLVDEYKKPGNYSLTLNSKTLPTGVYFLLLQSQDKIIINKFAIVK